jgi:ornithine decarboxylase
VPAERIEDAILGRRLRAIVASAPCRDGREDATSAACAAVFLLSRAEERSWAYENRCGVVIADLESGLLRSAQGGNELRRELAGAILRLMQYDRRQPQLGVPRSRAGRCSCAIGRAPVPSIWAGIFRDDICNTMVSLGDLLIRGTCLKAQQAAARTFGSVDLFRASLSSSNKVVNTALLSSGHRPVRPQQPQSNHHGALFIAGAIPVYLEADQTLGMVGPIDWAAFDEKTYGRS